MTKRRSPAVDIGRNGNGSGPKLNEEHILSTGIKVKLVPVPSATVVQAQRMIVNPPVPRIAIEGKEGLHENPVDPDYLQKIQDLNLERAEAQFDILALFGVILVDGLPDDDEWLQKLKLLVKFGRLDIDKYDLDDPLEREFVYKRYIAMSNSDWEILTELSGLSAEDVETAQDNFRSNSK